MRLMPMPLITALLLLALAGCGESVPFNPLVGGFKVTFAQGNPTQPGTSMAPRNFSATAEPFTIDVEALRHDMPGQVVDTTYSGWVVISSVPSGKLDRDPFAVQLKNGRASDVKVKLNLAHGAVRLVASDLGYKPAVDLTKAACLNGKDDDNDGFIDTMDRGCLIGGDDSEEGGSGATGASPPIHYAHPKLYDIQRPIPGVSVGDESPLDTQRVTVNRGWLLITNVASTGLYVTDFEGAKWDAAGSKWQIKAEDLSYDHMYAFNFNVPLNLQVGDCLVELDGRVEEFFGYTEMSFPNWKKGDSKYCFGKARAAGMTSCPADGDSASTAGKACRTRIETLASTPVDVSQAIDLTDPTTGKTEKIWPFKDSLFTERFEAGLVQVSSVKLFTTAKKCDFNLNGSIDFNDPNDPQELEEKCANGCGDDKTCIVHEQYQQYDTWSVNFTGTVDSTSYSQEVSVASAGNIPNWDPMSGCDFKKSADGKTCTHDTAKSLGKVIGILRTFKYGRPPWTIETRAPADCPDCDNSK